MYYALAGHQPALEIVSRFQMFTGLPLAVRLVSGAPIKNSCEARSLARVSERTRMRHNKKSVCGKWRELSGVNHAEIASSMTQPRKAKKSAGTQRSGAQTSFSAICKSELDALPQ